jgi:uncharacterized membrane protein
MIKSISVGSKVICTDGPGGIATSVIVDPVSHNLTHIAVVEKSILHGEERLVPVERVIKTTRDEVYLDCTVEAISQMEPFTRTHYLEVDRGVEGYGYAHPYITDQAGLMMTPELNYVQIQDQLVPEGEVVIQRGMQVEALDGRVGQVGELLIDGPSRQITHFLLMKGHGWGKKEVAIPVSMIARIEGDTIHLQTEKEKINQLPSLPIKRAWDEVHATDLELMVWTFAGKHLASQAFDKVQTLSKQYALEVLSATVIEKDANGDIHVHEEKKVPSRRKVTLGIALGGLAGIVIGPVALVAGAIAGAAAGKKSAKKVEVGFSKDKLDRLNASLVSGGSGLVLLAEHRWFGTLQQELAATGGQLIHERLADITLDDLVNDLNGEKDDKEVTS